ncbi:MAG TPA: hypothetical protein DEP72_02710 [Clostridiales bacterium]|nr:MAG: hypothetical protein A2Y18_08195 [Clostridiales bacterium GWD2_32_19]HCC07066.1 hypothetical protein [Clostridiales bacterium]
MSIRVSTWNISNGISAKWSLVEGVKKEEYTKKAGFIYEIIDFIKNEDIDVIGMQEIVTSSTKYDSHVKLIAENTDLKYYIDHETCDAHLIEYSRSGNAILSKYPIIEFEKILYTNPYLKVKSKTGKIYTTFDKSTIVAKIDHPDGQFYFITSHGHPYTRFNSTDIENKEIVREIYTIAEEYSIKGFPIILGMDSNIYNMKDVIPEFFDKYIDILKEPSRKDGRKTDNIIIKTNKLREINTYTINDTKSDHFLCISDVEII